MQFTPTSLRRTGRACLHASSSTGRHASDGESDPLAGTASSGLPGVPVCRDHVRQGPDWGRSMRPIAGQRLADLTRVTVRIAVTAATLSYLVRVGKWRRQRLTAFVQRVGRVALSPMRTCRSRRILRRARVGRVTIPRRYRHPTAGRTLRNDCRYRGVPQRADPAPKY